MTDARAIVESLGGRWHAERKAGRCRCPAHDDRDPSLDVTERDGGALMICRAGCDQQAVLAALRGRGLWHDAAEHPGNGALVHPELGAPRQTYEYYSADGRLIGAVCRWEPAAGKKEIRPAIREAGSWRWKAFADPRPLYRLPNIAAHPDKPVLMVEGEKAAEAAIELLPGYVVTTWPGGTGAVGKVDLSPLAGRHVVLWPDNDEPGRKAMRAVADRLTGAKSVRGVKLPEELPSGWDLADAIPADLDPVALAGAAVNVKTDRLAALNLVSAASLSAREYKAPRWAVPDLIPEGLTILAGNPKAGKSWLVLDIAVAVASGGHALGNVPCTAGDVLYLALEDTERRLQGRLRAVLQGAPAPERLFIGTQWRRADDGGLDDLRAWLSVHPDARFVAIDTLALIRGKPTRDQGVYAGDYEAVSAFKKLADEFSVPLVLVHHRRKEGSTDPLGSVSGTAGLTGSADTIVVLNRQPNERHGAIYVRGRDVIESEIAVEFDDATGKWVKLGAADDFRKSEARREIIRLLIDSVAPLLPNEIADALGKRRGAVRMLVSKMHRDGEISKLPNGKYYATAT
jgi:hypothetical protein